MKTFTRILCVCISMVLLTSCTAHITVEPEISPSPTATLAPNSSSASAPSSNTGASESAPTATPTPTATPKSTPLVPSSSGTVTSGDEALIKEAEYLVSCLVQDVFGYAMTDGITDINTAIEEKPNIVLLLPFALVNSKDPANPYRDYGQYSKDGASLYITEENATALLNRTLGLNELPNSVFDAYEYNSNQQRIEYSLEAGYLSDSYSYTDLTCTIDNATHTVHARFTLTDSGSYESNEVYGPYEMIFSILSDGETQYLRFKSVLPI